MTSVKEILNRYCSCDAVGDGPCPVHRRENDLQDALTHCRAKLSSAYREIADLKGALLKANKKIDTLTKRIQKGGK